MSVPLADGEVATDVSSTNLYLLNGNDYVGNFEYVFSNDLGDYQHDLDKIYNDEGYVQGLANPQYYYFRHDHLGDNREVWLANTNTVVQRTQYYPSGLPWVSLDGDNPSLQNKKYNGKEFVEMHGYDMYDFDHRGFYPAGNFFTTRDWKAEETPDVSPYSYACDNPIRYRDENGDGAGDKILGYAAALIDNGLGGMTPVRQMAAKLVSNAQDFNRGQDAGDIASIAIGAAEFIGGQGTESGGGAVVTASLLAEAPSGGTSTVTLAAGGVMIGAGEMMKGHGVLAMAAGTNNLATQKGRINVTVVTSTRKEAKEARPKPGPAKPGEKRVTNQTRNKSGEGNKMKTDGGSQTEHFHDKNHNNRNKPNVHYRTTKKIKPNEQ